ncbi:hypothetical protein PENSPDRAFT_756414 [Peniophora sp. CONT]|nr:hypothetical protein PENSPDRAFT_756414 [Peniophora sp. CONT]
MMMIMNLENLPVELLYEIYLFAANENLPSTSRHLLAVFRGAPTHVHAEYILNRHTRAQAKSKTTLVTRALRYPICTKDVLDALLRHPDCPSSIGDERPTLPRRLFSALNDNRPGGWRARHEPLPFLRYLYAHPRIPAPDPDSHEGYPLARAVKADFRPLIEFLLAQGASPKFKEGLPIKLAIQRRDLSLVKLLVEPSTSGTGAKTGGKRRRVSDRLDLGPAHLRVAVQAQADDIVHWLVREKRCVPDLRTLSSLRR